MVRALLRRLRSESNPVHVQTLGPRKVYILPTQSGLVFALVLVAMLLGAINYGNSLAYALTFMLASLAVVSILHTYRNLGHLSFRSMPAKPVFAGERAGFPLLIDNHRGPRFALDFSVKGGPSVVIDVAAGTSVLLEIAQPTSRRGRLPLGRVTVSTRFPLGMFRAWAYLHLDAYCLVYPHPEFSPLPPLSDGDAGRRPAGRSGSEEFFALRAYQAGDSPRRIHWKSFARGHELVTKDFHELQADTLLLSWQLLPPGEPEAQLSTMCGWILTAETKGLPYKVELPHRSIGPGLGEPHRRSCLEALALHGEK